LIIFGTAPAPPTISVIGGDTLVSSHASTYQWYLNGSPITGATDSFYVEHQNGTYAVQITDSTGGCNSISNGVAVGVFELRGNGELNIYPNPVADELVITHPFIMIGPISIYNVLGEKIMQEKLSISGHTTLNVKKLPSGFIFCVLSTQNEVLSVILVKNKFIEA